MRGAVLFKIIERLPILRVLETGRSFFARSSAPALLSSGALTNITEISGKTQPHAPNIGGLYSGWGVGMEAFGSPMIAAAIVPLFSTMSGFTPKKAGSQTQRSASFPTSIDPT